MDEKSLNRRTLLRTTALAGGVLLAGCSSGGNGTGGGDTPASSGDTPAGDGDTPASSDDTPASDGDTSAGGDTPGGTAADTQGGSGSCTPGFEQGTTSCSAIAASTTSMVPWEGKGADSLVEFDYPCGWSKPDVADDFSKKHSLVNVGHAFGDQGPQVDIQVRTYYAPYQEGYLDKQLENPNNVAMKIEYNGQTRRAVVTKVVDESFGTPARLTVPNPKTGQEHLVEILPTLHGGPCAKQVRKVVIAMLKSLRPNDGTTFEPIERTTTASSQS